MKALQNEQNFLISLHILVIQKITNALLILYTIIINNLCVRCSTSELQVTVWLVLKDYTLSCSFKEAQATRNSSLTILQFNNSRYNSRLEKCCGFWNLLQH